MVSDVALFLPSFFACIILLLFMKYCNNLTFVTNKMYAVSIISIMVVIIADLVELYYSKLPEPHFIRTLSSVMGYVFRPVSIYFLAFLAIKRPKIPNWVLIAPIIINAIIMILALFTKTVFWYDENNNFQRTVLGFTPFIVAVFYLILFVIGIIFEFVNGYKLNGFVIIIMAISTTTLLLVATLYNLDALLCNGLVINISFYYMFQHIHLANRDALTTAFLRRKFETDITFKSNKITGIIMLDIDGLKKFNDTFGHKSGDEVLKKIVFVTKDMLPKKSSLYRFGGDEFVITCSNLTSEKIEALILQIRNAIKKEGCTASFGYSMCKDDSIDAIRLALTEADLAMYTEKRNYKLK